MSAYSDSRLWDADPDVCCAAFQLGACSHTEGAYYEDVAMSDDGLDAAYAASITPTDNEAF